MVRQKQAQKMMPRMVNEPHMMMDAQTGMPQGYPGVRMMPRTGSTALFTKLGGGAPKEKTEGSWFKGGSIARSNPKRVSF